MYCDSTDPLCAVHRSEERRVGKDWYGVDLGGRRIIKKQQILCLLYISTIYCDEINHDVLDVPDVLDVLGVLDGTELLPTNDPKSLQPLY